MSRTLIVHTWLTVLLGATSAWAQRASAPVTFATSPAEPSARAFGVGGALGLGVERSTAVRAVYLAAIPPSLELRVALSPRVELGLWFPALNALPINGRTFVWADVFTTVYLLRDAGGLFIAPGAGFVYGSSMEASGVGLQVPVRVGYEFSERWASGSSAGVSLALRPWAELVLPNGPVDRAGRFGAFFEVSALWYAPRARR